MSHQHERMADYWENQAKPDDSRRHRVRLRRVGDDTSRHSDVGQSAGRHRAVTDGADVPHGTATGATVGAQPGGPPDRSAPDGGAADARPKVTARDESLDIIKAVLIILVVFAHLVEHFGTHDRVFSAAYSVLSLCGLPLFVLVCGMVAKPLLGDKEYRTMFAKLLLPLICLQPFYLALLQLAEHDAVRHILDPQWLLWFLLSLCLWRMMLPLFLRMPLALLVAIGITLAAGYAQYIGADLSLSRTLYFFPFFLAGYLWRDSVPRLVARARPVWVLVFALSMTGMFLWFLHGLDPAVVYHDRGYDRAAVWTEFPALGRLALLMIGALSCLTWMAMMPRKSKWLARLGRRTLTILALHGFVVLVCLKLFNIVGWTYSPTPLLFPVLLVMSVAIAWGVSLFDGPFNRFFDWLAARLSRLTPSRERSRAQSV